MIRLHLFLCSLSLFLPFGQLQFANAQQQVHGLVIDSTTSEPMPFVSIAISGTTFGTVSNQNGEFTLNLEKANPSDSIAFYYLGYETLKIRIQNLQDGMTVKIREKPFSLRSITIIAHPFSPEELIRKALERKAENYPVIAQKREVFSRSNQASYIKDFDLKLKKSDIVEVDKGLIKNMVDSIPRYIRSYDDYLYTLYTIPGDSAKTRNKVVGIKNVKLREADGGELDQIDRVLTDLFVKKPDSTTFWKYRTGLLSFKESHVKVSTSASDSAKFNQLIPLYSIHGDLGWDWDFIQKPNRYHYQNKGIIGVGSEDAFAISFEGKSRADYQGMLYISVETYAILRIEYSIKERKKDKGFDLLGVNYSEEKDDGLVLYEKDRLGYFLKYSMRNTAIRYGIDRSFDIIRKQKRPVLNKKVNEVDIKMNFQGNQEACYETLVVSRESSSSGQFARIQEKGVKADKITAYSDTIWKGYSIIEPTKQMKEYQVKIKN